MASEDANDKYSVKGMRLQRLHWLLLVAVLCFIAAARYGREQRGGALGSRLGGATVQPGAPAAEPMSGAEGGVKARARGSDGKADDPDARTHGDGIDVEYVDGDKARARNEGVSRGGDGGGPSATAIVGDPVLAATDDAYYPAHGFVRLPKLRRDLGPSADDGKLHIIFSTGCNYFQHWQSELLLTSAWLRGQRGRITRIVSGCHDRAAETVQHTHQTFPAGAADLLVPLRLLNRSVNEDFGLFITPSFEGALHFPWINKPNSINFFMQNARAELARLGETVVAILDPDFVFLKPLSQSSRDASEILMSESVSGDSSNNSPVDWVREGRPVAQRYGLGGAWTTKFSVAEITGDPASPAIAWSESKAAKYTSVGPPLLLHVNDLARLAPKWQEYMPRVLKRDNDILADMWAYSTAAAHLDLPHTTIDSYMISAAGSGGQAYPWVDAWTQLDCRDPTPQPGDKVPTFIHLASNFKAPDRKSGPWMFHKGHVPADFLHCDEPLIVEAPSDLWAISPDKRTKQNAFILCHTVAMLNKVALLYKGKFCPDGFEQRKLVRLIQSKDKDWRCKQTKDKWCWPLAQIEGLPDDWRSSLPSRNS
jgi:hypothetical protein